MADNKHEEMIPNRPVAKYLWSLRFVVTFRIEFKFLQIKILSENYKCIIKYHKPRDVDQNEIIGSAACFLEEILILPEKWTGPKSSTQHAASIYYYGNIIIALFTVVLIVGWFIILSVVFASN